MAAETCWIKDEHGRFMGRRPGCKMTKSGVMQMADKKVSDNTTTVIEPEGDNVGANAVDMDKKIREIMNKPDSQLTEEEKAFKKKFLEAQTKGVLEPWMELFKSAEFALLFGPFNARAIISAIAKDMAMDEIIKYANEKFPGYGAIGIALAALALSAAKVIKGIKGFSRATAKDAAKAEGPILERKAAEKAEKAATDAEKATVNPEKKVTEEAAKTEKEIGKWYDEAENYKWDPSSVERKKANIVDTGKISADEVKKTNQVAEQAAKEHAERALEKAKKEAAKEGRQLTKEELDLSHYEKPATKINAYKTEASQWDIEHSIEGHAEDEVKKKIADERAKYERVSPKYATPEADRGNMPLKKEDYQNIEKYRKQAVDAGTLEFPHKVDGELAKVKYMVKQDDGVICIRYRVDPINGKMTFETMWKEQYKNR